MNIDRKQIKGYRIMVKERRKFRKVTFNFDVPKGEAIIPRKGL